MLRSIIFALLWVVSVSVSAGQVKTTDHVPTKDELREQYAAYIAEATKSQEETHEMNEKLMARTEGLIARQEKDMTRFEKILDTWERQQAQYQKYLDSLGRK